MTVIDLSENIQSIHTSTPQSDQVSKLLWQEVLRKQGSRSGTKQRHLASTAMAQ